MNSMNDSSNSIHYRKSEAIIIVLAIRATVCFRVLHVFLWHLFCISIFSSMVRIGFTSLLFSWNKNYTFLYGRWPTKKDLSMNKYNKVSNVLLIQIFSWRVRVRVLLAIQCTNLSLNKINQWNVNVAWYYSYQIIIFPANYVIIRL